jgi:hypothetical protein
VQQFKNIKHEETGSLWWRNKSAAAKALAVEVENETSCNIAELVRGKIITFAGNKQTL